MRAGRRAGPGSAFPDPLWLAFALLGFILAVCLGLTALLLTGLP